jgi:hypothetical protein
LRTCENNAHTMVISQTSNPSFITNPVTLMGRGVL